MTDQNDSDSDWDSTLDFTSPRPTGMTQPPRIDLEIEDEDFSRQDSMADHKPTPAERFSVAINNKKNTEGRRSNRESPVPEIKEPPLYATVQKESKGKLVETKKADDSPPYNFRQAITGNITPDVQRDQNRPGKDRKGNIYDLAKTPEPTKSVIKHDSFKSVNSWDSDADERTLQELRANYSAEKKKEQEAESLKLQLQNQDPLYDDPQATNRSETTWKSLTTGFGEKIARLSGRGQKAKNQNKTQNTVDYPQQQQRKQEQEKRPQQPIPNIQNIPTKKSADLFRTTPDADEVDPPYVEGDLQMFQSYPTTVYPPYVTKEEEGGWTYYFGHNNNMQQYEAEDDAEHAFMPRIADKFERILTRVYQEFFGAIRIITSIGILLIVELLNFILKYILQPLIVGILGTLGEFFCKPLLSIFFNGFVQPLGIFLWNSAVSLRHMFGPIGDILRRILKEFAMCCRSFKPIEIHWKTGRRNSQEIQNV